MIHRLADVDPYSVRVSVYKNLRNGLWSILESSEMLPLMALLNPAARM
jgi:hypothetical protein